MNHVPRCAIAFADGRAAAPSVSGIIAFEYRPLAERTLFNTTPDETLRQCDAKRK